MQRSYWVLFFVFALLLPGTMPAEELAEVPKTQRDARFILKKLDHLWRGTSSKATLTMHIKTSHWERSLVMDLYTLDMNYSLVRVVKPLRERGTATLKIGSQTYNYLPKTDRTIKLTAAMMMDSWMGSHFTNDDLIKASRMADDYASTISFEGERQGQIITEMTLLPKPEAPVVWGKLLVTVRADDQPIKIVYYDEDGQAVRVMTFAEYSRVSGRLLPLRLTMTPLDKPGESTEVMYDKLAFDVGLTKDFFSLNELRK